MGYQTLRERLLWFVIDEFAEIYELPKIDTLHLPEKFLTKYLKSRGVALHGPEIEEISSVKAFKKKLETCVQDLKNESIFFAKVD